jgi:hypothetical protein
MWQFVPLVGTMKAAVDDIIHFFFRPDNPVQHDLTIRRPLVASNPVEHDLSSFVEGIQLYPEVINVSASLLTLGYYFEG